MSPTTILFKQAFTAQNINYYSYIKEYQTPEKYTSTVLKYKIFCCVWSIATIFHMANLNAFTANLSYFLLTCASIALIAKPSSIARLLIFISMQMYQAYSDLPEISNHWIFTTFVNLTILQSFVYLIIKRKSFFIDKAEFLETFTPLVKIELIILYFYAVFHKLNAGFFNTDASCAVEFLLLQNNYYNILPTDKSFLTLNIYATLLIETLIPVLICIKKSRSVGIVIGLIFHWVIAYNPINGFYDFSSMIFALYFLFTSTTFSENLRHHYNKLINKKTSFKNKLLKFNLTNFVIFSISIATSLVLIHFYNKIFQDFFRHIIWTAYSLLFIAILITSLSSKEKSEHRRAPQFAHYTLFIFPVLVFLNGLCPYLGLKTESSYAMFSNLRTEGGISNHYIVPASTQIFDYQKDLVEVVSSSDPLLQNQANEGKLIPFFQFRRYVRKNTPKNITYIRKGETKSFTLEKASMGDELLQKSSYPLEKLLYFRYIYKNGYQPCKH